MKITKNIFAVLGLFTLGFLCINAIRTKDNKPEKSSTNSLNDYNVYAIDIPPYLEFAGEELPQHNPDIKERIDREFLVNTYWQSNGLLLAKRANKYFPIIEPILDRYNIPDDFKYLAIAESGLTNAVSPAGARGVWQIMKTTGKEHGLEINDNVDERYHLEKSTEVACKYLLKSKQEFGSWTLAAAAYNAGNGGVNKRLKEQDVTNYYDLLLGEETGRYIFRIVALKTILSNPQQYGFNFEQHHLYNTVPTYSVEVDTTVTNFTTFAKKFGINYKILKLHNPWLREQHLNNKSRKSYLIKIPKSGYYTNN